MKLVPFKHSTTASLGVELEFQIINPNTSGLISRAKDLIRNIKESQYQKIIKPEITQSMIEINSTIHKSALELVKEFGETQSFLMQQGRKLNIRFSGGGTHPFQKWSVQKIFPTPRFKNLSRQYRYLSKRSTVFGQHIHVGCSNPENAIYLTHALARYVPQLIALSASSPFYQGIDTGYHSCRSNIFSAFPLSGVIPYLTTWNEFSTYYYKMRNLGIVGSMKDFYWDIRPKPEFGTVEVRVCDMPLTIHKAICIAAYIQTLSNYLMQERPITVSHDLYHLYSYNRFQAMRYGYEGIFINPENFQNTYIGNDILDTIKAIEPHTKELNNETFISQIIDDVGNKQNDVSILRQILKQTNSLSKVVIEQCNMWEEAI